MEIARTAALIAATVTMGLIAGLFYAYTYSVMPGLGRAGDRTFVEAMQRINVAILNGWFFLIFIGALVFTIAAGVLYLPNTQRGALPWIVAAVVLYVVVLAVTGRINVPLNDQLNAAVTVNAADFAAARERFEATWVRWNLVRTVACTAAFGCLTWALVLHGRISSS